MSSVTTLICQEGLGFLSLCHLSMGGIKQFVGVRSKARVTSDSNALYANTDNFGTNSFGANGI